MSGITSSVTQQSSTCINIRSLKEALASTTQKTKGTLIKSLDCGRKHHHLNLYKRSLNLHDYVREYVDILKVQEKTIFISYCMWISQHCSECSYSCARFGYVY